MYYKIVTGFGDLDYIEIDESLVEDAIKAQVTGKTVLTPEGSISGSVIQKVTLDFNRMGRYGRGYKLTVEDMRDIPKSMIAEHRNFLEEITVNIKRSSQGLPPLPKREGISEGAKQLSEKFNINKKQI